jgi:hypothetical protein
LQNELTEASAPGAILSAVAAIVMIGLIFAELQAYVAVTTESKVVLDHFESSSDDTLQVNWSLASACFGAIWLLACVTKKKNR